MIELQKVNKIYNSNGISNIGLRNINLKFNKNEIVAIVGDSGSGKSTLLNVICKNDTFDDGEILYKGNETSYFSIKDMDDFRKNKVGFIFQNYNIIDSYTVLENVMIPLVLKGINKSDAKIKALELIKRVGLEGKENSRGTKLSGGQKQRCVIARALASDCEILACDEPTGNLDSKTSKEIIELIKEVAKDKLVLIVTHNYEDFEKICTRKIRIKDGEVVEDINFVKQEEEKNVELNLDYVPLERKIDIRIALNNIKFTPKKTIFILTIFMVVFILAYILLTALSFNISTLSSYNEYTNRQKDRGYVYKIDNTPIENIEKYQNNKKITYIETMPYYEDYTIGESTLPSGFFTMSCSNLKLLNGAYPKNDNEILLIIPDKYSGEEFLSYINKTYKIFRLNNIKLTGIAYSTTPSSNLYLINETIRKELIYNYTYINATVKIENKQLIINEFKTEQDTKPYIVLPIEYKDKVDVTLTLNDLYKYLDYEIKYENIEEENSALYYNPNKLDQIFEISVYANDISAVEKIFTKDGLKFDICHKVSDGEDLYSLILNISTYMIIFLIYCFIVIVFFITYFILAKVYASKKIDYQILRTLGVTKKDMAKIVKYEVAITGLIAMITSMIISEVLYRVVPGMYIVTKPITIIIYFIIAILFILAIANRFNKKLFKFSVARSMKVGEFDD